MDFKTCGLDKLCVVYGTVVVVIVVVGGSIGGRGRNQCEDWTVFAITVTIAWKAFCKCKFLTNARRTDGSTYVLDLASGLFDLCINKENLGNFLL